MDYQTPLSPEQRQEILTELHRREFLEKQALAEEEAARKAEAQRQYNAALALEAARKEDERKAQLLTDLSYSCRKLADALEALQEGDETECYRLLVLANPNVGLVMQRLNQKVTITDIGAGLPTVRVKRATALGYAIVNAEDVTPADEILED